MLTPQQIQELKEHLERAQNPLFYYDNDADGLCSFIILRRYLGRGKGVAVRSFPDLHESYARKAQELKADYIFVLDKPILSKEFVATIDSMQLPLVWLDHHDVPGTDFVRDYKNVFVYNPSKLLGPQKSFEPTTYLSYKITGRKEDLWLAIMGCVADHYLPEFASEFAAFYPEFWGDDVKDPFDAYFKTEIGRIAMSINFGLKDSVTHVVQLQNHLVACKGPGDVLSEIPGNYAFRHKVSDVKKRYDSLMKRAKMQAKGSLVFFEYGGELSISADLANQLYFLYPDSYVAVVYKRDMIANVSLRGKNIKNVLEQVLREIPGTGGGHEDAVGARIKTTDLNSFKEALERAISQKNNEGT